VKLSPADLINLATGAVTEHVDRAATDKLPQGSVAIVEQLPIAGNPGWAPFTMTGDERTAAIIRAASIMLAESGGDTQAVCYNVTGANGQPTCSKTGPAGPKGRDRGLWQFNEKAFPDISDQAAFDAHQSTALAYIISSGFRSFGPWAKSKGMDPTSQPSQQIQAAYESMLGRAVPKGIFGLPGEEQFYDFVQGAVGSVTDWADGLRQLLAHLLSAAWWRRVGLGALGVLLVVIAVALLVASSKLG
jgi:hypothetical protein